VSLSGPVRRSRAYEVYLDAVQDVKWLALFRGRQQIQREVWNIRVPPGVKSRLKEHVRVEPNVVYLTALGLSVLGYSELGG
jgi:hypothetical protein